jgi:hypothetical protein
MVLRLEGRGSTLPQRETESIDPVWRKVAWGQPNIRKTKLVSAKNVKQCASYAQCDEASDFQYLARSSFTCLRSIQSTHLNCDGWGWNLRYPQHEDQTTHVVQGRIFTFVYLIRSYRPPRSNNISRMSASSEVNSIRFRSGFTSYCELRTPQNPSQHTRTLLCL